jgi:hypothetical protein
MVSIYVYKTSTRPAESTVRYEINNLETLSVKLEQPVSPMALPQEDSDENILVKMEGNTETLNVTWKIPDVATSLIKQESSVLTTGQIQSDADGTTPVSWDTTPNYKKSGETIAWLLNEFQGRNISDRYFLKLPDISIREGFMTSISFTIAGDSPVVWQANLNMIVGNVISIYDADAPSNPANVAASQVDSGGDTAGEGGGTPDRIRLRWTTPTDSTTSIVRYKIYEGSDSQAMMLRYDLADSGLDGAVSGDNSYKEKEVVGAGLVSGRTYYYRISAVNAADEGLKSDRVSVAFP